MRRAVIAPPESISRLDTLPSPWPGRTVRLDGTGTYVRETPATTPDAEPALYVHGLGGSAQNWTDLAPLLAHRLAGQAIDLPGFGHSDPARRYGIGALARRVARWIEQSDRGPVHLVGNSLGGAVSVQVAADRPDLVRTLTLISPAMPFLDPRRSVQARMLPLLLLPRGDRIAYRRMTAVPPAELARQVLATCFADPDRLPAQRLAEAAEEARLRYDVPWYLTAYVRTMRGLVASFLRAYLPGSGSLWRVAARIKVPTLVIAGTRDRLVDVRVPAAVARAVPDARLLMLDGVGHVAQMEAPEITARAMIALLDEVAAAPVPRTRPLPAAPAVWSSGPGPRVA